MNPKWRLKFTGSKKGDRLGGICLTESLFVSLFFSFLYTDICFKFVNDWWHVIDNLIAVSRLKQLMFFSCSKYSKIKLLADDLSHYKRLKYVIEATLSQMTTKQLIKMTSLVTSCFYFELISNFLLIFILAPLWLSARLLAQSSGSEEEMLRHWCLRSQHWVQRWVWAG